MEGWLPFQKIADKSSITPSFIIFIRLYSEQQMNFEEAELDNSSTPNNKSKILGVIVLRDNRQVEPIRKGSQSDYRCSAFKQTQVDPLDYANDPHPCYQDENLVAELTRRVAFLEKRVKALSNNEVLGQSQGEGNRGLKKKNRRKFQQLVRNHECFFCKKVYGSDTSLKYHLKLKHNQPISHSQSQ